MAIKKNKTFQCENCEVLFSLNYRRSHIPKYCSIKCRSLFTIKRQENKLKQCSKCKNFKPKKDFGQSPARKGYRYNCQDCRDSYTSTINDQYQKSHGMSYSTYKKGTDHEAFLLDLLKVAKGRSSKKKLEFSITHADLVKKFNEQNGNCSLSGEKLTHIVNSGIILTNMSIDRIDSSKGYILDNIQIVCYVTNFMKNSMTVPQLKFWCAKILGVSI